MILEIYTFISFVAWPTDQRTKYNRWSLSYGFLKKIKNTSILISSREIGFSKFYALCCVASQTDIQTGKVFKEYILINERNVHKKKPTSILTVGQENRVSPKRSYQRVRQTFVFIEKFRFFKIFMNGRNNSKKHMCSEIFFIQNWISSIIKMKTSNKILKDF